MFFKNPEKQNSALSFNKNKVQQPQVRFNFEYVVLTTVQILAIFLADFGLILFEK